MNGPTRPRVNPLALARPHRRLALCAYVVGNALALGIVLFAGHAVGLGRIGMYIAGLVTGWALASLLHGRLLLVHLREVVASYHVGIHAGRQRAFEERPMRATDQPRTTED